MENETCPMTGEPHVFSNQKSASGMSVTVCASCGKLGVTEPDSAGAKSLKEAESLRREGGSIRTVVVEDVAASEKLIKPRPQQPANPEALSALLADVQHEIDVVWQARLGSKDYGTFDLLSTRLTELRNVRKYLKQRLSEVA